jgi:nucleoside-diphosphate-sugar epimerase
VTSCGRKKRLVGVRMTVYGQPVHQRRCIQALTLRGSFRNVEGSIWLKQHRLYISWDWPPICHNLLRDYGGKQVRDNIHSQDLVRAFHYFYQNPRPGEVYNIGGSRHSNCSVLEAISLCEQIGGRKFRWTYIDEPRKGDHIWWISDVSKFRSHYPAWRYQFTLRDTIEQLFESNLARANRVAMAGVL